MVIHILNQILPKRILPELNYAIKAFKIGLCSNSTTLVVARLSKVLNTAFDRFKFLKLYRSNFLFLDFFVENKSEIFH